MIAANCVFRAQLLKTCCCAMLLAAPTAGYCAADDESVERQVRTWTDDTGAFTIRASFVDYEKGGVILKQPDGTEVTAPFDRLSSSDQHRVRDELRRRSVVRRREARPAARLESIAGVDVKLQAKASANRSAVAPGTENLYGINWHSSPADALAAGPENEKPVMWFRVLGDLAGFM